LSRLRVLIVDDEEDMRVLLRNLITLANDGMSVAAEAGDGEEAIHRWREDRPEIVLLDQRMPGLTGLATAERILAEDPDQAVVLFTAFLDPDVAASAERLGVRACLSKRDTRALVARLRTCAA
jgi:DNA-binding NarL/FixJ family response regulator